MTTRPTPFALRSITGLGLLTLTLLGCNVASFGSTPGRTDLYVQNDTSLPVLVSFVVFSGEVAEDGSAELAPDERTLLVQELASGTLMPSQIIESMQVTSIDGSMVLLDLPVTEDEDWLALEDNGNTYAAFEFVLPAEDN